MAAGKGDRRRPLGCSYETYAKNWDAVFGKPKKAGKPKPAKKDKKSKKGF
jgi:hypothetical protein